MKIKKRVKTTISIELTATEALWLKLFLQNNVVQGVLEREDSLKIRKRLFIELDGLELNPDE